MKQLEWDSNFWDIDIYSTDGDISLDDLASVKARSGNWLIQALVPESEVAVINLLEDKSFRFIESKITLCKTLTKSNYSGDSCFRELKKQDIFPYQDYFYSLYGSVSRFKIFSREKVNLFYYTWVINSIDGILDDKCIGFYLDNELAGFVTLKITAPKATIGLIGVFPDFQKRGVSQKLLDYVSNDALNNKCNELYVSTQGNNIKAINAYIKNGFLISSINNWYYLKGEGK